MTTRLEYFGKIYGVLVVSISRSITLDTEEWQLFEEVAGDIALALNAIEVNEKKEES